MPEEKTTEAQAATDVPISATPSTAGAELDLNVKAPVVKVVNAKHAWSTTEDAKLIETVGKLGAERWPLVATHLPGRMGKQCRERWFNHLCPDVNKSEWTPEEDAVIAQGVIELGTKWSEIVKRLPGRTDNSIKNRYNSNKRRLIRASSQDKPPEPGPTAGNTSTTSLQAPPAAQDGKGDPVPTQASATTVPAQTAPLLMPPQLKADAVADASVPAPVPTSTPRAGVGPKRSGSKPKASAATPLSENAQTQTPTIAKPAKSMKSAKQPLHQEAAVSKLSSNPSGPLADMTHAGVNTGLETNTQTSPHTQTGNQKGAFTAARTPGTANSESANVRKRRVVELATLLVKGGNTLELLSQLKEATRPFVKKRKHTAATKTAATLTAVAAVATADNLTEKAATDVLATMGGKTATKTAAATTTAAMVTVTAAAAAAAATGVMPSKPSVGTEEPPLDLEEALDELFSNAGSADSPCRPVMGDVDDKDVLVDSAVDCAMDTVVDGAIDGAIDIAIENVGDYGAVMSGSKLQEKRPRRDGKRSANSIRSKKQRLAGTPLSNSGNADSAGAEKVVEKAGEKAEEKAERANNSGVSTPWVARRGAANKLSLEVDVSGSMAEPSFELLSGDVLITCEGDQIDVSIADSPMVDEAPIMSPLSDAAVNQKLYGSFKEMHAAQPGADATGADANADDDDADDADAGEGGDWLSLYRPGQAACLPSPEHPNALMPLLTPSNNKLCAALVDVFLPHRPICCV